MTLRYVALGDSYTIGISVARAEAWPERLSATLGTRSDGRPRLSLVANLATNGRTSGDVLRDQLPRLDRLTPEFLSLLIGVNDVVQGVLAKRYRENLTAILDQLRSRLPASRLLAVTTPDYTVTPAGGGYGDPTAQRSRIVEFNAILTDLAVARGIEIVDIFDISENAARTARWLPPTDFIRRPGSTICGFGASDRSSRGCLTESDVELPALAFLAAVLTVKEAGLPIPVPGDLLVIGAGAAAAHGGLPAGAIVIALLGATVLGGAIQFVLVRGRARNAVLRLLARVGLRPATIEQGAARFRRGGPTAVAIARMTPGVRIVAIASSAIAEVSLPSFLIGLVIGNGVFLTGHFALGLILGEPAVKLMASAGAGLLAAGIAFASLGAVGWFLIARRRARGQTVRGSQTAPNGLVTLDWTDACCPACLTLALVASTTRGPNLA